MAKVYRQKAIKGCHLILGALHHGYDHDGRLRGALL